jgi:hypothetical protein
VNRRFAGVNRQFAGVNQQFAGVNRPFAGVNRKFAGVNRKFAGVNGPVKSPSCRADDRNAAATSITRWIGSAARFGWAARAVQPRSVIMGTVPVKLLDRLAWYRQHAPVWDLNASAIGVVPTTATAFSMRVETVDQSYQDLLAARETARAREVEFKEAYNLMSEVGANLVRTIRAFAQTSGSDQVYATAQIPPPKTPAPVAAPGTPYAPAVALQPGGSLKLSWKCNNPSDGTGVMYEIHRADGTGAMTHVGTVGTRSFTDATIPAGSSTVNYTVTAIRSTLKGTAGQFVVQFGTSGGAGAAGSIGTASVRKAA